MTTTSSASAARSCANPDCQVGKTGKCVEGLALADCPKLKSPSAPAPADEATPAVEAPERAESVIPLPSGEKYTGADIDEILGDDDSRVLAFLGPADSGKTSLIAAVYDAFQHGHLDRVQFVRSDTLIALEQACHRARAVSQGLKPGTDRTRLGDHGYYHIALKHTSRSVATSLLLADRAGEEYLEAVNEVDTCLSFPELARANTLTLLLDGARLLDDQQRHNARSELQLLLQALGESGVLRARQRLAIVLTKLDELETSSQKARAISDFERTVEWVRANCPEQVAVASFKVAACPTKTALERGHGVPDLLEYWMEPSCCWQSRVCPNATERAIDRFGRTPEGEGDV